MAMTNVKLYSGKLLKKGMFKNMVRIMAWQHTGLYNSICREYSISPTGLGWFVDETKPNEPMMKSFTFSVEGFDVFYDFDRIIVVGVFAKSILDMPKELKKKLSQSIGFSLFKNPNFNIQLLLSEMA